MYSSFGKNDLFQTLYDFDKVTSTFLLLAWCIIFAVLLHSALEQTQGWENFVKGNWFLCWFTTLGHWLKNWGWGWSPDEQNMKHAISLGKESIRKDSKFEACKRKGATWMEWEVREFRGQQVRVDSPPIWLFFFTYGQTWNLWFHSGLDRTLKFNLGSDFSSEHFLHAIGCYWLKVNKG